MSWFCFLFQALLVTHCTCVCGETMYHCSVQTMCPFHLLTMMLQALMWFVAMTVSCCSAMDPMMQVHASETLVLQEVEQVEQLVA